MKYRGFLTIYLLLSLGINPAHAQFIKIDDLRANVKTFATSHFENVFKKQAKRGDVDVEISSLDQRLRLKSCNKPLDFVVNSPSQLSTNATVKTSCKGSNRWTIYVPIRVNVYDNVVVAARDLSRGEVIQDEDLALQRVNINQFGGGYLASKKQVTGMEVKRTIRAGESLKLTYLQPTDVISRGDAVLLESRNTSVMISVSGTALDHGHIGEQIRVRNNQSEKIVDAMVTGPGKVSVVSR